jgi:hypothetical protein
MLRSIRLAAAALVLAACDMPTESQSPTPIPGEPSVQRQVWEQQDIDDYRYVYARGCFCVELPLVNVRVRDGQVVDVRVASTGRLLDRDRWDEIPTVDDVFDLIAQAEARDEATDVKYHPTLGYPMRVMLGTLANDSGVNYYLDGLDPVD